MKVVVPLAAVGTLCQQQFFKNVRSMFFRNILDPKVLCKLPHMKIAVLREQKMRRCLIRNFPNGFFTGKSYL